MDQNKFTSAVAPQDEILGRLAQALESAADPDTVIRQFVADHPDHAEAIREHAHWEQAMRQAAPATGRLKFGQRLGAFTITRFITAGGMGEVYEAEQRDLGRSVALKVIRAERASEQTRSRFRREREVLARLHQTHIVPVFAAGEEAGLEYVAMHLIEGASLSHVVQALNVGETLFTGTTSAGSLAEVAKVIHNRALKEAKLNFATTAALQSSARSPTQQQPTATSHERRPSSPDLDAAYYHSVAETLAKAAEAVQTAHDRGVCHRDLKPSNIMIEPSGKCWLIDFGLATQPPAVVGTVRMTQRSDAESPVLATGEERLVTRGPLGTPEYMAPEQFDHAGDERLWDVYALGATLYELLCLRPPLGHGPTRETAHSENPPSPRTINSSIGRDISAICMKALRRRPEERYATAGEFSKDLHRWLEGYATQARPGWHTLRPVRLWIWRNKAWAALLVVAALAAIAVYAAKAGEVTELQRGVVLTKATQARLGPRHRAGWRKETLGLIEQAHFMRSGSDLRSHAVAAFAGPDAKRILNDKSPSSWVAIDDGGQLVLVSPAECDDTAVNRQTTRICNMATGEVEFKMSRCLCGPVAFRRDGVAIQLALAATETPSLQLWDVRKDALIETYSLPGGAKPRSNSLVPGIRFTLTLTPSGSHFALAVRQVDGQDAVLLWEMGRTEPLAIIPQSANVMAISDDGRFAALGNDDGTTVVWSLPELQVVSRFEDESGAITGLRFGWRPRIGRNADQGNQGAGESLLAIATAGGRITVWKLGSTMPPIQCAGSDFEVFALKFSADGQYMLSAGRDNARLWDLATGRTVLELGVGSFITDAAISPDNQRLAFAAPTVSFGPGSLKAFELENGRGIDTLYGLDSRVKRTVISADGRRLAALSQSWQLAVWDTSTRRLAMVADVPHGNYADSAGVAFSPDGHQITVVASDKAKTWNIDTREVVGEWQLNPSLINRAYVQANGEILTARIETDDGKTFPDSNAPPHSHPRRCRVWRLQTAGKRELVTEIKDFSWHVMDLLMTSDGRHIVLDGYDARRSDGGAHLLAVYDCRTGEQLWSPKLTNARREGAVLQGLDPLDELLSMTPNAAIDACSIVEIRTGKLRSIIAPSARIGPGGRLGFRLESADSGIEIRQMDQQQPFIVFDRDALVEPPSVQFDARSRLAWGLIDGTVRIADFPILRRALAEYGMEW